MTGNNKLFSYEYNGKVYYVHASDLKQAAIMFKEKLSLDYVDPFDCRLCKEPKPLYVYRAWYIQDGRTKYLYIVARSLKQAWFMFFNDGYTKKEDFSHKDIFVEKLLEKNYSFGIYPEESTIGRQIAFYD